MNRRLALSFAAALSILSLAACPSTSTAGEDLVLKAYDVPAEHAAELQGIIANLLWSGGKDAPRRGAAALAPSGQLLVSAPAGFQPGIADVIARLKSAPAQRAPTVTLDYWVVVGAPSSTPTQGSAVSPEIAEVVTSLQKAEGNMSMALLERLRVSSQSGSEGHVEGSLTAARQVAALHGDKVVADLSLHGSRLKGELSTRVEIPVGQVVVLGQAGAWLVGDGARVLTDEALSKAGENGALTAFYVVKATVDGK